MQLTALRSAAYADVSRTPLRGALGDKMTKEDFVNRIRKEYLKARKTLIEDSKIIRGTSHSISSLSEDIFGKFISDLITNDYEIWIDPQISVKAIRNASGKRVKTFRPDVCVYAKTKKRIELIFDLKMDLGYKRKDFIEFSKNRDEELNVIKENNGTWNRDKVKMEFCFNKDLKWNYIVLSEGNITKEQIENVKRGFKNNMDSNLFILSSGEHLNTYNEENFIINDEAFNSIISIVNQRCG